MKKPSVSIVILNWNGKDHLERFLPSVCKSTYEALEIFVIDNQSNDDSLDFLKNNYPEIKIIVNDQNYGFAGGYNKGLEKVDSDYYILLNSDVEVEKNWIEPLVKLAESNKNIAAIQPKIRWYRDKPKFEYAGGSGGFMDYLGYPFCRGRIFDHLEEDNQQYNDTKPIFWATGCAFFTPKEKFWELGGFDSDLFAHQEEIDLCWRFQNKGYEVWAEPKSLVYHLGGGTLNQGNPKKDYLNFRNNLIIILKNHPKPYTTLFKRFFLDQITLLKFISDGKSKNAFAIFKAYKDFLKAWSKTIRKRKAQSIPKDLLTTIFKKSIVLNYFAKGKKKFSDLEF